MPKKFIEYKRLVDAFLTKYLHQRRSALKRINQWGTDIIDPLVSFATAGKTIRGSLVLFTQEAYGKKVTDEALRVASALELTHAGFLIHDDIMDGDTMRRGKPALHVQYGTNVAICIGDFTFFLAQELMGGFAPLLAREYQAVCLAQMQDVSMAEGKSIPSEEEVLSLYRYKTARYTFSLPLVAGAMLAGVPAKEQQKLESLGETMGLLFQIHDDMLNLTGTIRQTGKSVGGDVAKNKKTLPFLYGFNENMIKQKEEKLAREATASIATLTMNSEAKNDLRSFISFLLNRTR